jgi:hypothetical protein
MRKRKIFPILVLVLALLGGAYWYLSTRSKGAWETYVRDARERGVKLSLMDFVPPPIPDEENAAAVPIFANLPWDGGSTPAVLELRKPNVKAEPERNDLGELEGWRAQFVAEGILAADSSELAPAAVLRALDLKYGEPWAELKAAIERPKHRFPVRWDQHFGAKLPHFSIIMNAGRIASLRGRAHTAQAAGPESLADVRDTLRIAQLLEGEPTLIAMLVRSSVVIGAMGQIRDGIESHIWDEAALAELAREAARVDLLRDHRFALETERGALNDLYAGVVQKSPGARSQALQGLGLPNFPLPVAWFYRNQLLSNQYFDEFATRIDPTSAKFNPTPLKIDPKKLSESRFNRLSCALFLLSAPVYESTERRVLENYTKVQCARASIALERWRLAHMRYPAALSELVPTFLDAIPHDVIDGKPLRYRQEGEGFTLYSVGMDGKDDGGTVKPGVKADKQPDWVWTVKASPGGPW